jgi:hypothetical protein
VESFVPLIDMQLTTTLDGQTNMDGQTELRFQALKSAPLESWVALSEDETKVVAVGTSYEEAVRNSEKVGVSDPVFVKTPKVWMPISV